MRYPLEPYLSPEARDEALDRLAAAARGEVLTYGESVEGRPLRVARLPRYGPAGPTRRVLVCANIHGVELIAAAVALGVLEATDTLSGLRTLRERAEIWVIPSLNPDGYAHTWERDGIGELGELRTNARGVDLNRNFPLPAPQPRYALSLGGWATGSDDVKSPFYRGPKALSEPETAALEALLIQHGYAASVSLHSSMGTLLPAFVKSRTAFAGYRQACAAFQRAQPHTRYRQLASRRLNWFTGELEDHQHHAHESWAITVETFPLLASYRQHLRAPSLFWRANPRDPRHWVENDVPGLAAFLSAALELGRPPS